MGQKFDKTIGILGGAGPWASAHAVMSIIQKAQWDYKAVEDDDYPELILRSVPLKGFGARGIESPEVLWQQLIDHFNRFDQDNIGIAVIACNSLYRFYSDLQDLYPQIYIIHLPEEGAKAIKRQNYQTAGVLSSASARDDNMHKIALDQQNIKSILPTQAQQDTINELIYAVMAGNSGAREAQAFRALCKDFEQSGAKVLLSGCTELSYLSHKYQSLLPVVDCLYVSLEKALYCALARRI